MADQVTTNARSMVERLFDPKVQDNVTKRGRALVAAIGEAAEMASERAATGWRDAEPIRRDAARAGRDALQWGNRTWRQEMLPGLNRLWNKRTVALSAAGAAVPVARELIDDAAVRMGIRARREQRHWGAFFGGLLLSHSPLLQGFNAFFRFTLQHGKCYHIIVDLSDHLINDLKLTFLGQN